MTGVPIRDSRVRTKTHSDGEGRHYSYAAESQETPTMVGLVFHFSIVLIFMKSYNF